MIIGSGTIASVLTDREDRLYFASGVSNSQETDEAEYDREIELLMEQDKGRHLVYFSTLSRYFTNSRYTQHKATMEELVMMWFPHWTIMRLGNPVWGKNPKHLIPYFKDKVAKGEKLEIQDVYRHPLELDEFIYWVDLIPEWNCEMNITTKPMKVRDIVNKYVL